jgi:hypothetical protein
MTCPFSRIGVAPGGIIVPETVPEAAGTVGVDLGVDVGVGVDVVDVVDD